MRASSSFTRKEEVETNERKRKTEQLNVPMANDFEKAVHGARPMSPRSVRATASSEAVSNAMAGFEGAALIGL